MTSGISNKFSTFKADEVMEVILGARIDGSSLQKIIVIALEISMEWKDRNIQGRNSSLQVHEVEMENGGTCKLPSPATVKNK